jgi:hypothetical protein
MRRSQPVHLRLMWVRIFAGGGPLSSSTRATEGGFDSATISSAAIPAHLAFIGEAHQAQVILESERVVAFGGSAPAAIGPAALDLYLDMHSGRKGVVAFAYGGRGEQGCPFRENHLNPRPRRHSSKSRTRTL